jgi:alanyl-tRNA synthetase
LAYTIVEEEVRKFQKTLHAGLKILEKTECMTGKIAFDLYQTYGFPLEVTIELLRQKGKTCSNVDEFTKEFKKHQDLSRTASKGMFKGGLADHGEQTTRLHTATHLLHAALQKVLGTHVSQKGSNITVERLRFDFFHPAKVTPEELKKVEEIVNEQITKDLPITMKVSTYEEAIKEGAMAFFSQKYPEKVKVYTVGPSTGSGSPFSREVCGGPHVEHTGLLGHFKILKEESAGAGIRRIYAVVESSCHPRA